MTRQEGQSGGGLSRNQLDDLYTEYEAAHGRSPEVGVPKAPVADGGEKKWHQRRRFRYPAYAAGALLVLNTCTGIFSGEDDGKAPVPVQTYTHDSGAAAPAETLQPGADTGAITDDETAGIPSVAPSASSIAPNKSGISCQANGWEVVGSEGQNFKVAFDVARANGEAFGDDVDVVVAGYELSSKQFTGEVPDEMQNGKTVATLTLDPSLEQQPLYGVYAVDKATKESVRCIAVEHAGSEFQGVDHQLPMTYPN